MTGDDGRPDAGEDPDLAQAVQELRAILRQFDAVEPSSMSMHFYIHAYNELDLLARAVIDEYDRWRTRSPL